MKESPEQLNVKKQESQEQDVGFSEQNLIDPDLMKSIHESASLSREEAERNPDKLVELREELDKIFGTVSPENVKELLSEAEKQDYWEKTMEGLDQVGDRTGRPIDKGIKETVAAFIVNELPTQQSCEGHVEERSGKTIKIAPYVDIGKNVPDIRYVGEQEIRKKIAEQFGVDPEKLEKDDAARRAYWDYTMEHNIQETPEYLSARGENEKMKGAVDSLLDDFYKERPYAERRISTEKFEEDGSFHVTTKQTHDRRGAGIDDQHIGEAKEELSREQEEFRAFTEFMKSRYFGAVKK